jgi:radical SAM superfamily enzyme YgiQ (UPF0313 family)
MDIDKALDEIKWLKETYGFKYLQFISDNMTIKKSWLIEFMHKYKIRIDKPFLMNIRCNEVDESIIQVLRFAGCNRIDFGVEHGCSFIRNDVLKRNMSIKQIVETGKLLNEYNIRFQTTNIFGVPHEDFNKAWHSVLMNRLFKPEISKACILQPFKNTAIYNYASEQGLLKDVEYTGTTLQIGVEDKRAGQTLIKVKNEKQIIRLSYLFDLFVKVPIPEWLGFLICSLPLNCIYKLWYKHLFNKQNRRFK